MKIIKLMGIVAVLICLLFITSCELKRNNPLDPETNPDIITPPQITGLTASGNSVGVYLAWNKNDDNYTDGYYIYKSLAYNAAYERIATISNVTPGQTVSINLSNLAAGNYYYFKVSAYKSYPDGILEGPWSNYVYARVGK
jgi:hypothetical protein